MTSSLSGSFFRCHIRSEDVEAIQGLEGISVSDPLEREMTREEKSLLQQGVNLVAVWDNCANIIGTSPERIKQAVISYKAHAGPRLA